jgi:homoserine trans-succinylase
MMKRVSVGFREDEYEKLQEIMDWYAHQIGTKLSMCATIKAILFARFNDAKQSG